jgi:hypothetical protein
VSAPDPLLSASAMRSATGATTCGVHRNYIGDSERAERRRSHILSPPAPQKA